MKNLCATVISQGNSSSYRYITYPSC